MEKSKPPTENTRGKAFLETIGRGQYIGYPTGHEKDGEPVLSEDFEVLCGEGINMVYDSLARTSPGTPEHQAMIRFAQSMFDKNVKIELEQQG